MTIRDAGELEKRPLQRAFLGNQIADSLRRDILLGILKPGTRLSQQQLCEQFGTSRMPVRDGLRSLAHEGLLLADAGRHLIVAPISRADMTDSFLIEGMLAGMAAERASAAAKPEDIQALTSFHVNMLDAADRNAFAEMADLNWGLHRSINRMARSRKLLAAIRTVSLDVPRDFLTQVPHWSARSNEDHESILDAMKAQEHVEAGERMKLHIIRSGEGLLEYLESAGLELDN